MSYIRTFLMVYIFYMHRNGGMYVVFGLTLPSFIPFRLLSPTFQNPANLQLEIRKLQEDAEEQRQRMEQGRQQTSNLGELFEGGKDGPKLIDIFCTRLNAISGP